MRLSEFMNEQVKANVLEGKQKGQIFDQGKRWDLKDQKEFEKKPIADLLSDPYYLGVDEHICPVCHGKKVVTIINEENEEEEVECIECEGLGIITQQIFESHKQDILELWKLRQTKKVTTAIFQEGIGSGKTMKFCIIQWLLVTEVITKFDPQSYYTLAKKGQGISFVCMSRNEKLAKEVTFLTLLPFFNCGFYNEHFPPQVDLGKITGIGSAIARYPSRLRFPKNIVVFPGTGSAMAAIGYNLFGGGVDESNYLEVVDRSKKAIHGGSYDAAEDMHTAIKARMKSRFEPNRLYRKGKLPGLLVMFSNPRYAGDFTSRMGVKAKKDKTIFFRKRCTWEAQPKERFTSGMFWYDVYNRRIVPHSEILDLVKLGLITKEYIIKQQQTYGKAI